MTVEELLDLAKRKNSVHKELVRLRAMVRPPAGTGKMTEKDRDIEMDFKTAEKREEYENMCDEYAIQLLNLYGPNAIPVLYRS